MNARCLRTLPCGGAVRGASGDLMLRVDGSCALKCGYDSSDPNSVANVQHVGGPEGRCAPLVWVPLWNRHDGASPKWCVEN